MQHFLSNLNWLLLNSRISLLYILIIFTIGQLAHLRIACLAAAGVSSSL